MIQTSISHIDETLSSKGARTLDIRVSSSVSFDTPTRPISTRESAAKNFLGYRGEIESPIAAIPMDLKTGDRYEKFRRNNGFIKDEQRALQSFVYSNYNRPSFTILQLPPLKTEDIVPLKIAFDMQKDVDALDIMCIPEIVSTPQQFERTVRTWCESAEDVNKNAIPQIFLKDPVDTFGQKLDILCEMSKSGNIPIVNVRYSSDCPQQLAEIWSRRDRLESILNCSEVPFSGQQSLAKGIVNNLETDLIEHGFDSITRAKRTVSPKYIAMRNMEQAPSTLSNIDSFKISSHNASLMIDGKYWQQMKHPPECHCSVCRGNSKEAIIEQFAYKDNGDISPQGMRYYSTLHDHQSDIQELDILRKYIKSNEISEYDNRIEDNRSIFIQSLDKQ